MDIIKKYNEIKCDYKKINACIISTNKKMVKLLKNNRVFIKLKNELKKNTNKINYDKLILFLNKFNDEFMYILAFNFLKFFFSKSKYKKLKCQIIKLKKHIILSEKIKLLYGKYYNWCYIDDFGKVVYNNSFSHTSNNYNNYINNNIPFPNEIYKDSCSKNECKIIKKNFVLITSEVGSYTNLTTRQKVFIVIVLFFILLFLGFFAYAIFFAEAAEFVVEAEVGAEIGEGVYLNSSDLDFLEVVLEDLIQI